MGKGKIIRERYERTASGYDELYRAEQYEKFFIALKKYRPRGVVLDAGCGTGLLIEFLRLQGLLAGVEKYYCVDYSGEMLKIASQRVSLYCPNKCVLVEGNVMHLHFQGEVFDITYSFTVLDLVDDLGAALRELKRVSKGPVIVSLLKTLPYKDRLIEMGAKIVGVSSKDVIFRVDSVEPSI
jgi:ubiquinone/menaquinone biosynthesis C-methylase UbiE